MQLIFHIFFTFFQEIFAVFVFAWKISVFPTKTLDKNLFLRYDKNSTKRGFVFFFCFQLNHLCYCVFIIYYGITETKRQIFQKGVVKVSTGVLQLEKLSVATR